MTAEHDIIDIVSPDNAPLTYIRFGVSKIRQYQEFRIKEDRNECIIVLLSGTIRITHSGTQTVELSRTSVFSERASALYIPPTRSASLFAMQDSEMAVIRTDPKDRMVADNTIVIKPENVKTRIVGKKSWCRTVQDIIPVDFPAGVPVIGETINEPGKWSSSPPHKHDMANPPNESRHEEIYYYRLEPEQGFGLQRIYSLDGDLDHTYTVKQGDVVVIPKGYHPVVAGPGYQLYYLWVLAGEQRQTLLSEDPAHNWIHNA
ncbi:5-deoxy-glucuronate isomerase [Methanocalculus taiwanensis]|nr:5-deoxy-glucuronate isomerase [Methanocalculus taiwanensis]